MIQLIRRLFRNAKPMTANTSIAVCMPIMFLHAFCAVGYAGLAWGKEAGIAVFALEAIVIGFFAFKGLKFAAAEVEVKAETR